MKDDFSSYPVGTVFNPIKNQFKESTPQHREVSIEFPSRLNAMAIDPSKIATNENMVFTPGEVVFAIAITKKIQVTVVQSSSKIAINATAKRKSLILHAALLMKAALGFENGLMIDVDNSDELKHCGLGSSSSLIAGVAAAINEVYGNPIPHNVLLKYIAQNHGEEIDNDDEQLMPVQCIGGSASSGLYEGSALILTGENTVIVNKKIDNKAVLIGIPNDFIPRDSEELLEDEIKNFNKFIATGVKYGKEIAYDMLHKAIPGLYNNDLSALGDLIFRYRFDMGSIDNCSFVFPRMNSIANNLRQPYSVHKPDVLALSSVGPAFFVICEQKDESTWATIFENENMKVLPTKLYNTKYKVLHTE